MREKTEREKMISGEQYNFLNSELIAARERTKEILRRYNSAVAPPEREDLLGQLLGSVGRDSGIESPFFCTYGRHTHLGDHAYLNAFCTILDNNEVRIGNHVMIGPAVQIYTAAHPLQAGPRNQGLEVAKPIAIEDNVWIGGSAVLLPGVTVGTGAVVGAGAVVTRDVPANVVVAGNPARVIREIESPSTYT
jgi:maltose O-acetyltransferase